MQLRELVEILALLKKDWTRQREIWQVLIDFLFYWTTDVVKFREIGTNIDEYLRLLGYSPLCQQLSDLDDTDAIPFSTASDIDYEVTGFSRNDPELIRKAIGNGQYILRSNTIFKPGWVISMLLLGNFSTLEFFPNSNSLLTDGWARMQNLQEVINMWTLMKLYFPKELFTRRERVDAALAMVTNNQKDLWLKVFEGTGIVINQVIPIEGSYVYLKKFNYVKDQLLDIYPELFGITNTVIFKGRRKVDPSLDKPFKYHTLSDKSIKANVTVDYRTLFNLTRDDRVFQTLRADGPIHFKIPTLVKAYEISADKFYPVVYKKVDIGSNEKGVQDIEIFEVPVMYRWEDDDRRMTKFALLMDPVWSTDMLPFMVIKPSELVKLVLHDAEVFKNYDQFNTFERDMIYK